VDGGSRCAERPPFLGHRQRFTMEVCSTAAPTTGHLLHAERQVNRFIDRSCCSATIAALSPPCRRVSESVLCKHLSPTASFRFTAAITCLGASAHAADAREPLNRTASVGRPYASLFPTAPIDVDGTPQVEVLWARPQGGQSEWDVVPQVQVTLSKLQHVMIAAGAASRQPAAGPTGAGSGLRALGPVRRRSLRVLESERDDKGGVTRNRAVDVRRAVRDAPCGCQAIAQRAAAVQARRACGHRDVCAFARLPRLPQQSGRADRGGCVDRCVMARHHHGQRGAGQISSPDPTPLNWRFISDTRGPDGRGCSSPAPRSSSRRR
jgi:hypothetical protein